MIESERVPTATVNPAARPSTLIVVYLLLLVVGAAAVWWILSTGERLTAGPISPTDVTTADAAASDATTNVPRSSASHTLPKVLGALIIIILTSRLLGMLFRSFGQPRVIGEVVAGILLGPSLLGHIAPSTANWLFPPEILPLLGILAQLGIILYMFLIGLELNASLLRGHAQATLTIAHTSIVVPFVLGCLLSLWLFNRYAPSGVSFTSFALFQGVAMSITAFPVLARILTDRKLEHTELGVIAISCAAADDVTAWCLLTVIVGVAQSQISSSLLTAGLTFVYVGLMFFVVRPIVLRWLSGDRATSLTRDVTALVLVALLASAWATDVIGIHAIFGAFLLGAVIPHDSHMASEFRHRLEDVVSILLLPVFFAHAGMRTELGLLSNMQDWWYCLAIIAVATIGKFGGTYFAARFVGRDRSMSAALGILMNTRGLMELIVLNMGLELGVISPALFAMMVVMALVTTVATSPLLRFQSSPAQLS